MNQWKRLLFYIVLNVLVSALTTLGVLWMWDRQAHPASIPQPAASPTQAPLAQQATLAEEMPLPTLPPSGDQPRLITIDNVFGVGNLKDELVLFKRTGEGELTLTGWRLDDGSGNSYTFPELTLYPGGAIQVHTAFGTNSVVDLFWGRDGSVWQVGKVASLYDAQGILRATYRIP
jgi:hypothetical protein